MKRSDARKSKVDSAFQDVGKYTFLYKVAADNKSQYLQMARKAMESRGETKAVFGKYRMVEKVLRKLLRDRSVDELETMGGSRSLEGKVLLYVMSNRPREDLEASIREVNYYDYEHKGSLFSKEVRLGRGELLNEESVKLSSILLKDLQSLGLPHVKINEKTNNLELEEEIVLGKEGEEVTENQAKIMRLLGIKNKKHEAFVVAEAGICTK